jgi:hypothetical protein
MLKIGLGRSQQICGGGKDLGIKTTIEQDPGRPKRVLGNEVVWEPLAWKLSHNSAAYFNQSSGKKGSSTVQMHYHPLAILSIFTQSQI